MCLNAKLVPNPKYRVNKKNGGNVPPCPDDRLKYVPIGCQQCIECRKQKARSWQVRLLEDVRRHKNGKFVTFTFSNESIWELDKQVRPEFTGYDRDNQIATLGVRLFLERFRKQHGKSVRHWLVTECGHNGTENIHLHGIIWTDVSLDNIEKHWKYGFVWKGKPVNGKLVNYVNEQTVNYIIKYVNKVDEKHKTYLPAILTSKGIGANYMERHDAKTNAYRDKSTNEAYRTRTGHKINLPIYYRNKIYTETQREKLWLEKLDKEERWVMGERVSVRNDRGQDEYRRLVAWHKRKAKELGYIDIEEITLEQFQYERQRRDIMRQTRIAQAKAKAAKKGKTAKGRKAIR